MITAMTTSALFGYLALAVMMFLISATIRTLYHGGYRSAGPLRHVESNWASDNLPSRSYSTEQPHLLH